MASNPKFRGQYNRFLRSEEPVPKSTYYANEAKKLKHSDEDTDDHLTDPSPTDLDDQLSMSDSFESTGSNSMDYDSNDLNNSSTDLTDFAIEMDQVSVRLNNNNEPLYPGSDVTTLDAYITVLAFALRHNLTQACMQDLLKLLEVLLPSNNLPPTKHVFFSKLSSLFDNSCDVHMYCKYCFSDICLLADKHKPNNCSNCLKEFNAEENKRDGIFFLYMPLTPQLIVKFQSENIFEKITAYKNSSGTSDTYRDIVDGTCYSKIKELEEPNNISLQFNIDGLPVFKKANYSIWPIQCIINEMHPEDRKKHLLLCGLWFGPQKPFMDTFLKPFVDELLVLSQTGFQWKEPKSSKYIISKCFPVLCSNDAPARAAVQNFKQFNGKYGCGFCLQKGERVEKGRGHCHVYVAEDPFPPLRTFQQTVDHAADATADGTPIYGIKGPSQLMRLYPHFNIVESFVPDYMHAVLLGVSRQILGLWFNTSGLEYSMSKMSLSLLNERISTIQLPHECKRVLRSVQDFPYWKASEFRIFLLVSPVLLVKLLPHKVYTHWLLFVHGVIMLLGSDISKDDIAEAEVSLRKFVEMVQEIYGIQEHSYNVPLLLHLSQAVSCWGPLWAHSCFPYEDALGHLKSFHHGTKGVASQILSSYIYHSILKLLIVSTKTHSAEVDAYISNLQGGHKISQKSVKIDDCTLIGLGAEIHLLRTHKLAIFSLTGLQDSNVSSVISYKRILHCSKIFSTLEYSNKFLRTDCVVGITQNICLCITHIIVFQEDLFIIGEVLQTAVFKKKVEDVGFLCRNILICDNMGSDNIIPVRPKDIILKYAIIPLNEKFYLVPSINSAEQ